MRAGGGKAKGSSFERMICKALSLWVSRGEEEDLFWRSAMSGGRATVSRKTTGRTLARQAGDITATAPEGHKLTDLFYIECKFVKTLGITNFVYDRGSPIRGFWDVAVREAHAHKREAMLIAKENNGIILVIMASEVARQYRWGRESVIARVLHAESSIAVLSFDQMITEAFSTRVVER